MSNGIFFFLVLLSYLILRPILKFILNFFSFPRKGQSKYFVDPQGRIKIYHGVNICNYSKWSEDRLPWHTEKDYQRLKEHGFNLVRFVIFWEAIEPEKGVYNQEYITKVKNHIKILSDLGIDVILDLHQDLYNKKFSGNGFPDWALPEGDLPFEPKKDWYMNYLNKSVIKSYNHFWNSYELKSKYIDLLSHVQDQFKDTDNVIGIDVMNEPVPPLPSIFNFETKILYSFYRILKIEMTGKIQTIPFFLEPPIYTSAGIPSFLYSKSSMALSKYIPHYYPPFCHYKGTYNKFNKFLMFIGLRSKARESQKIKSPFIIGEFGIAPKVKNRFTCIKDFINLSDKYCMSWAWWAYDKIEHDIQGLLDNEGNPNLVMESLTRAYPQRIAGTNPTYYNDGDRFYLEYTDDMGCKAPTEIYIPGKIINITSNTSFVLDSDDRGIRKFYNKEKGKQKIEITWGSM